MSLCTDGYGQTCAFEWHSSETWPNSSLRELKSSLLVGLDFYNRSPGELMGKTRMAASVDNYFPVVGARMLRVLPAFGIGGIGNRMLRAEMIKRIEGGL